MVTSADTDENQGMNKISIAAKGLLLASLLVTSSAWAKWVKVAETADANFYIDPASIRKEGNMRKVWEIQDFNKRDDAGRMSRRIKSEYDCKGERHRDLAISTHSESMAGGGTIYSGSGINPWSEIPPGSASEAILEAVCAK